MSEQREPQIGQKWECEDNGVLWRISGHPGEPTAGMIENIMQPSLTWRRVVTVPVDHPGIEALRDDIPEIRAAAVDLRMMRDHEGAAAMDARAVALESLLTALSGAPSHTEGPTP